jgi:hypothetical protein
MAVVNVNDPKEINKVDPHAAVVHEDQDVVALNNEVKKQRARRELVQEMKMTDDLTNPPAPEPIFKVTGGVNLGTIDLQEQQRQAREETARMQRESQERITRAEREVQEVRDSLNKANLEHMQQTLGGQIAQLQSAIQSGSRKDIFSELENIENVAAKLGFSKTNGAAAAGMDSFKAQIELKRLEQELKREDRKFALEMKRDERMWQLELKKLDMQRLESEAKLESEKNKWNMIAGIPEQLGGVIAKGLIDHGVSGGAVASQPQQQSNPQKPRMVEADEGAAGQFPCPVCGAMVGIGPTSAGAVCAKCGQTFNVTRIGAPVPVSPETGAQAV